MIGTILLVFAFVLACLAAAVVAVVPPRVHLGWAAVACYFLSLLLGSLLR